MEADFAVLDEEIVKLEAEVAATTGEVERQLAKELQELKAKRMELAAQGDVALATGADEEQQLKTEDQLYEIGSDPS